MITVEFYRGERGNQCGHTIDDILAWTDERLEAQHDFVQWVFPLQVPSNYNEDAPLPSDEELTVCKTDPLIQENFDRACCRFLSYLGLRETAEGVEPGDNFSERQKLVWRAFNHNYLRVTRFLESMRLFGRHDRSAAVYKCLTDLGAKQQIVLGAGTEIYWHKTQG